MISSRLLRNLTPVLRPEPCILHLSLRNSNSQSVYTYYVTQRTDKIGAVHVKCADGSSIVLWGAAEFPGAVSSSADKHDLSQDYCCLQPNSYPRASVSKLLADAFSLSYQYADDSFGCPLCHGARPTTSPSSASFSYISLATPFIFFSTYFQKSTKTHSDLSDTV